MSHFSIVKSLIHKLCWQSVWLALIALPNLAYSTPTDLDPHFGTGGIMLNTVGGNSSINSMIIQPDNKILAVGQGVNANAQTAMTVVRYFPDGKLDTSFGRAKNGVVTEVIKSATFAQDVDLQPDGKIVLVAQELVSTGEFIVARLLPDGNFDSNFAGTGKVVTPLSPVGKPAAANALEIQADGKIVVAGSSENSNTNLDITLVRYNLNGTLDTGFGTGGKVVTSLSAGRDEANDVLIQADGKIIVGGSSFNGKSDDFAVVRYNPNGTLDNTFGINGIVTLPADSNGGAIHDLAQQTDGRIIAAGMSHNGVNKNFTVIQLLQNGILDNKFGGTALGKLVISFGPVDSEVYSVAIQADGKILLGGYGDKSPGMSLFALTRLQPDGILDATFGNNGKILTEISPPNQEYISQVALQNDGKILVAGTSSRSASESQFALVRYMGDPPANPEIEVQQNQVTIANNASVDFGITSQGMDVSKTFLVTNQGNAPLTLITPIQINNTATTPNAFTSTGTFTLVNDVGNSSTVSASSLMLSAGSTASFTVKLSGQTVGNYSGSATFSNNDSDETPYTVALTGQVTTDKISKLELWDGATLIDNTLTQIDLGSTMQGQPLSRIFVVKNIGNADLVLSNWVFPPGFKVNGALPTTIAAGASIAFNIQLDGVTPGLYSGKLQFNSNDTGKNPFIFEIKGFVGAMGQTTPLGISQLEVSEGGVYLQDNLSRIDFGRVSRGFPVGREIMLHNMGNTPLQINTLVLPDDFHLRGAFPTVLEPNSRVPVQIEFISKEAGNYSGALTFKSSDVKRSTVSIYLAGIAEEFTSTTSSGMPPPPPNGMIEDNRSNLGSTMTDVKISPTGSVTGGNLSGDIKNQGLIANVNLAPNATLDGGKISGFNTNHGTMCNMEVSNYSRVEGGVYCGHVLNQGTLADPKIEKNAVIQGDGMLSGTVRNDGMVCGMRLEAGAQVVGGQIGCNIKGKEEDPAIIGKAQIQADTKLENVCLTRSVVMSSNVTVGNNVTVNSSSGEPVMQDYCIAPRQVPAFDDKRIKGTEKDAFQTFDASNVAVLPEQAATGFSSEQMGEFKKEAMMGFKPEQFKQMPPEALSGLTKENVGGFQSKVLREMTPESLNAMQPEALRGTEDFAKIATNVDLVKLKPKNFKPVLPENWQMDETTGKLHPPPGSKISFKAMDAPALSAQVEMPMDMPDLSSSLAVGGRPIAGETVVEKLNQTLSSKGFKEYSLKQSHTGVVMVEGSSSSKDVSLALLPDSDNMQQVDTTQQTTGVAVDKTGRYMVTTEDGWQIPMMPAPQDVSDLANVLGTDSVVKVGKKGDVLMSYTTTQRRGARANEEVYIYIVVIFDPFVDPSLQDYCDASGCDWSKIPGDFQPGVNFNDTRAKQQMTVVYSQGKAQKAYPTVLAPDSFIKEAQKFAGVEAVTYNTDGSFTLTYQGQTLYLYPTTQVTGKKLEQYETVKPSLIRRDDGALEYSVQTGDLLLTSVVLIGE